MQASTTIAQSTTLHIFDVLGFTNCAIVQAPTTVSQSMTLHIVDVLEFSSICSPPMPKLRKVTVPTTDAISGGLDTDGEKSLSSPESDEEDSSYQDPNTEMQESKDDSAHVKGSTGQSADKTSIGETEEDGEDADAAGVDGDDDFQKSTNPELTARKKVFYKEDDKRMEQ